MLVTLTDYIDIDGLEQTIKCSIMPLLKTVLYLLYHAYLITILSCGSLARKPRKFSMSEREEKEEILKILNKSLSIFHPLSLYKSHKSLDLIPHFHVPFGLPTVRRGCRGRNRLSVL